MKKLVPATVLPILSFSASAAEQKLSKTFVVNKDRLANLLGQVK